MSITTMDGCKYVDGTMNSLHIQANACHGHPLDPRPGAQPAGLRQPAATATEAKTQLSRLVDQAVKGEAFVIAKAGKPLVRVSALDAPAKPRRLGFLAGEIEVPADFDRMGAAEIATLLRLGG